MSLIIVPITLRAANAFVKQYHRHSAPVTGCRFAVACRVKSVVVGVAICGRPVARGLDNGLTLEVLRLCTNGTYNACSFLYGASRRIGRAMGYQVIITYTLKSEGGLSLLACGANPVAVVNGRQWSCLSRSRDIKAVEDRIRWEL